MTSDTTSTSTSGIVKRPDSECPKCGHLYGFLWSKPRYSDTLRLLVWNCETCGYEVYTKTADAS